MTLRSLHNQVRRMKTLTEALVSRYSPLRVIPCLRVLPSSYKVASAKTGSNEKAGLTIDK